MTRKYELHSGQRGSALGVRVTPRASQNQTLLSDREVEVLTFMVKGLTTHQIAGSLFISDNTVKTHIRHILEKLDANNRAQAVEKARELGIL